MAQFFWARVIFLVFLFINGHAFGFRPDELRIGIVRYGTETASFDPYPSLWRELAGAIESATSIETDPVFKTYLSIRDKELGHFGILFIMGSANFSGFSLEERERLRQWIVLGGGILVVWNTDTSGIFDKKFREEVQKIFGDTALRVISKEHALFRSFYLVRSVGGILQRSRVLEGVLVAERYGVIYSPNDIGGALMKDASGSYIFSCYPGGEEQRKETFKLAINTFVYALTGTYKSDIIHLPFIEQKLKR